MPYDNSAIHFHSNLPLAILKTETSGPGSTPPPGGLFPPAPPSRVESVKQIPERRDPHAQVLMELVETLNRFPKPDSKHVLDGAG